MMIRSRAVAFFAIVSASCAIDIKATDVVINVVNERYLSWNIDPSCNRGFHQINFTNPNLHAAGLYLSPSRLRFGGSGADFLRYSLTEGAPDCSDIVPAPPPLNPGCDYVTPGCLNASHFTDLLNFGTAATADFIFGVAFNYTEVCAVKTSPWDSSNAERLLTFFSVSNRTVWGCELGNEINNNCDIPAQQAAAVNTLASLLSQSNPTTTTTSTVHLVGPDVGGGGNPIEFAAQFLGNVTSGTMTAVTHHVYLSLERRDFDSPAILAKKLDSQIPVILEFVAMVRSSKAEGAQIWAGEMGPIGGGDDGSCGTNSTCGTFASVFWYADDAALRAAAGYTQHNRQTLFGGEYGLVNSAQSIMALGPLEALKIRPDYWLAWLMKRTLGTSVYAASSSDSLVRVYAWGGKPPSLFAAVTFCTPAAPQLLLLNLQATSVAIALPFNATSFALWSLAPSDGDVFSTSATLNGVPLPVDIDVASIDPSTYLGFITTPPIVGKVSEGITLPGWAVSVVCLA